MPRRLLPTFSVALKDSHSHPTTQGLALNYGSDQYGLLEQWNQSLRRNSPRSPSFPGEGGEKTDQEWKEKTWNEFQMYPEFLHIFSGG